AGSGSRRARHERGGRDGTHEPGARAGRGESAGLSVLWSWEFTAMVGLGTAWTRPRHPTRRPGPGGTAPRLQQDPLLVSGGGKATVESGRLASARQLGRQAPRLSETSRFVL